MTIAAVLHNHFDLFLHSDEHISCGDSRKSSTFIESEILSKKQVNKVLKLLSNNKLLSVFSTQKRVQLLSSGKTRYLLKTLHLCWIYDAQKLLNFL